MQGTRVQRGVHQVVYYPHYEWKWMTKILTPAYLVIIILYIIVSRVFSQFFFFLREGGRGTFRDDFRTLLGTESDGEGRIWSETETDEGKLEKFVC